MENNKFENFLIAKNDRIDNAAFELIKALVSSSEKEEDAVEWDMEYIGAVVDMVESYLEERGFQVCHPYYGGEGRTPCVDCGYCSNENCSLKKEK